VRRNRGHLGDRKSSFRPTPTSGLRSICSFLAVVTDYVVAETINLANARSGSSVATRVLDLLEQSAGIRIEWIGTTRFDMTKAFIRKHADHAYSFTDCTSFVLMHELGISQALTSDRQFG
jgi:predicted nucleic acid-binding protein